LSSHDWIFARWDSGIQDSAFYGDERPILNDACGWSDEPIRVVIDHGELIEVRPDTTWYLLGGG
jgi:hypothetical protein